MGAVFAVVWEVILSYESAPDANKGMGFFTVVKLDPSPGVIPPIVGAVVGRIQEHRNRARQYRYLIF